MPKTTPMDLDGMIRELYTERKRLDRVIRKLELQTKRTRPEQRPRKRMSVLGKRKAVA